MGDQKIPDTVAEVIKDAAAIKTIKVLEAEEAIESPEKIKETSNNKSALLKF